MYREKIIDNLNFESNCLLMLHPIRAVTLSRDFKDEAEHIDNICKTKNFCIEVLTRYDI